MPSDLDQLAQDTDHQDRWGMAPTGNGLQDVASRGLPPPQPTPYGIARAQEQQQRWGGYGQGPATAAGQAYGALQGLSDQYGGQPFMTGLPAVAEQAARYGAAETKRINDLIGTAMSDEDPYTRAYTAAQLARETITGTMGAAPRGALGMAGGRGFIIKPESREYFNSSVGKTIPEQEFLQRYWAGYDNPKKPNVALTYFHDKNDLGHRLSISGDLIKNGQSAGDMQRIIEPEKGYAYHAGLHIDPDFRRQGIAKSIYRSQRDVYNQIGINRIGILADEDGAATWGLFGYKPLPKEWINNRRRMLNRIDQFSAMMRNAEGSEITPEVLNYMKQVIHSDDPRGNWKISDVDIPLTVPRRDEDGFMRMEESTLGREVLRDIPWHGEMNYRDPEQVRRQNDFLR